ncbi:endonuclease/exonuclease/phosphatase family protein [Spirosoma sp. KUDC1026]|uniref:endonuclease/exonuclease/phosphatase family protein n=1 Tax=Spirosoma sp. KUDC1026 TaxID=2745947 RepID=UPI00159B989E|nr:endonuclease/exonuclease/phosphatase family protein [Spirosoma sp. KUDC1026]QKZ14708.1 endonuclease/exonuclease/phosphatase family protein [Spirosoma sp. KUDC1026]
MSVIRKLLVYFLLLAGSLLILITLCSLIYSSSLWFLQVLNFPRPEVLIALIVCLTAYLLASKQQTIARRVFLTGMVVSIGIQAYILFPYSPLANEAVRSAEPASVNRKSVFSILVANVWIENRQVNDLLNIIADKDPTFVLTMEVNDWWVGQLQVLKKRYPYTITFPTDNAYGMALHSKLPLNNPQIQFLHHPRVPSFWADVTLPDGKTFRLVTLHPVAPAPSKYPTNIGGKEVALVRAGRMLAGHSQPTVVAGDFNDVGWSHNTTKFARVSGLHDIRYGRGLYSTFNAHSWLMRWPLDYVFVSSHFRVLAVDRLPGFGSDHFPYYVQLTLQP